MDNQEKKTDVNIGYGKEDLKDITFDILIEYMGEEEYVK